MTSESPVHDASVPKRSRKTAVTIGGKTVYLNNKELLAEIKVAKIEGRMTDKLAAMLQLLCARYARKGNFVNYSYNQDMQSYAMLMLVKTWNSFNPDKGSNPFAFFTQCIKNSFRQYLNHEKKHRDIRDAELMNQGLNPSYGYDSGAKDINLFEDEQDFHSTYVFSKDSDSISRDAGFDDNQPLVDPDAEPIDPTVADAAPTSDDLDNFDPTK